jgi:hypothetical protein
MMSPATNKIVQTPYILVKNLRIAALGAPTAVRELISVVMGLYSAHSSFPIMVCNMSDYADHTKWHKILF